MTTEYFDPRYKGLDQEESLSILDMMQTAQEQAVQAVRPALPKLAHAAEEAVERLRDETAGGRILYAGAGTPARLGVLDGTELTPTFGWPRERVAFLIAGGQAALLSAVEGAEDNIDQAERDFESLMPPAGAQDVCLAISASGRTPYTLEICRRARAAGALTIALACNDGTPLLAAADHGIFIESGPEPVGGSTRLNAGTVQKIALNMISTLIMIRLGHVYDGLMVDMKLNNDKLRARALRMICEITGCDENAARQALRESGDHVKLAVLCAKGLPPAQGLALLKSCDGNLRTALAGL